MPNRPGTPDELLGVFGACFGRAPPPLAPSVPWAPAPSAPPPGAPCAPRAPPPRAPSAPAAPPKPIRLATPPQKPNCAVGAGGGVSQKFASCFAFFGVVT